MMMRGSKWKAIFAAATFAASLVAGGDFEELVVSGTFTTPAEAIIGRPITPVSVAGVARRTTRRVVRRSTIYIATLPHGCAQIGINGVMYWQCGATYYQPYGTQYVVVYVD